MTSGKKNSVAATSTATTWACCCHIVMIMPHSVALLYWPLRPSVTIGHMFACTNTIIAVRISASITFTLSA